MRFDPIGSAAVRSIPSQPIPFHPSVHLCTEMRANWHLAQSSSLIYIYNNNNNNNNQRMPAELEEEEEAQQQQLWKHHSSWSLTRLASQMKQMINQHPRLRAPLQISVKSLSISTNSRNWLKSPRPTSGWLLGRAVRVLVCAKVVVGPED